ncbi:MAG: CAP domain-containing protein [Desulfobulbus sp.]|jgi:uncharacterized protein YkwD
MIRSRARRTVVVSLLIVLVTASLSGPRSLGAAEASTSSTAYARELLELINRYRKDNGLRKLYAHAGLTRLAREHSGDMAQRRRLGHQGFKERFQRSGRSPCTENVGWNHATPQAQFEGWRRSAGHDRNMLHPQIRWAGIAEQNGYVTFFACR